MSDPRHEGLLIVIVGPTAIGKTSIAIRLAEHFHTDIISADSRQFYRDLNIGVARPTEEELRKVHHHFIAFLDLESAWSAGTFASAAQPVIDQLIREKSVAIVTGGSMLYVDALLYGLDDVPAWPEIRDQLSARQKSEGTEYLYAELTRLDPVYAAEVDRHNPHRVIRALEVCLGSGRPYSERRTATKKPLPYQTMIIGLSSERNWLYDRINTRVDGMMRAGLLQEVQSLYPGRHLNALNTVGYKEIFSYLDGSCTLDEAADKIRQHTRNYAKRQLTWWRNRDDVKWFPVDQGEDPVTSIIRYIESKA